MADIKAADVAKLRKMTGAGMMDCKKALVESEGDFTKAVEFIRERGQAIANKRADRETKEGAVISKVSSDGKLGALIALNCETDFVAKNDSFVAFANQILDIALENNAENLDALKEMNIEGIKIGDKIVEQSGVTGEKFDLSVYEKIAAEQVVSYIHPGNKLATIAGFTVAGVDTQVYRDVAMQIAAMDPVAVDKSQVAQEVQDEEFKIGREQARLEGKPEKILDKIAEGRLNKFFKERTLLQQDFVKDNKQSIDQYLKGVNADLTVTSFKRVSLDA